MISPHRSAWLALGVTWLVAASCSDGPQNFGGQTGDGSDFGPPDDPAPEQAITADLANDCSNDDDEVDDPEQTIPELGFSANDLVEAIRISNSTVAWSAAGAGEAPTDESIRISVEYVGGKITHRFYNPELVEEVALDEDGAASELGDKPELELAALPEPDGIEVGGAPPDSDGAQEDDSNPCPPELQVEVEMTVRTSDGTLDETFTTVVSASDLSLISFHHDLPAQDVDGNFAFEPTTEGDELSTLSFDGEFTRYGSSGYIWWQADGELAGDGEAIGEGTGGDSVASSTGGQLAIWPSGEGCAKSAIGEAPRIPIESDQELEQFDIDDALNLFQGMEPLPMLWSGPSAWRGETAELSLEVEALAGLCIDVEARAGERLGYAARVSARSSDGHLDGAYDAHIIAVGSEGALTEGQLSVELLDVPVDDISRFGLDELEVGEHERVSFSLSISRYLGSEQVMGWFSVNGMSEPECPEPLTRDGAAAPCDRAEPLVEAQIGSTAREDAEALESTEAPDLAAE